MQIALIGATGRTGRHVLHRLDSDGHDVRVLARDPSRLPEPAERADVVVGSATDPAALAQLVAGVDVVISALGPTDRKEASLHQTTARMLVRAMRSAGVHRYVGVSGSGVDMPGDHKSLPNRLVSSAMQRFAGPAVADKVAESRIWVDSGLDWTLVRPPRLTDGPRLGRVEHHAHTSPRRTSICRADLADFLVDVAERGSYLRQAPLVSAGIR